MPKTAIVTGGTAGIGKAIALLLASQGANVIIFGTNSDRAAKACQEIESVKVNSEQKVLSFLVNVAKSKEVDEVIQNILTSFGKVDILVNNAGITKDNLLMRMSEEDWDTVLDTNLRGAFLFTKVFARGFLKQRSGRIINVASVIGLMGNAGQANYAASKAGLIGFTKAVAREFGSRSITVNALAPGFIETDMTAALNDEVRQEVLKKIPLNRFGQADDIAGAALFLASPAARYITGQVLTVDGGMVM
jgi:3-oxoacyl-[acyl-carrier protein] reductase